MQLLRWHVDRSKGLGLPGLTCLTMLAIACAWSPIEAQVVRGVVRETAGGTDVPGVLVTLERVAAQTAAGALSVLSNERGEYAIRAPGPGRYRLAAKRIGVRRSVTESFDLSEGETREVTVEIEPLVYTLPEVAVATADFCIVRREQEGRVASLWDEVRTALTATSITVRDTLYRGSVVMFGRLLDGRGRILNENRYQREGLLRQTFTSADPESLSVHGFWRDEADTVRFDAPDVDVLLSRAFMRDHCFELVDDANGETGLRFTPARGRTVGDVQGTIWLDARSFELRRVEFGYTRMERVPRADRFGGEVHFARLASGAWVVRRWFIRSPQFTRQVARRDAQQRFGRPDPTPIRLSVDRIADNRMLENGGVAYVDHLRTFETPATITGSVRDSTGAVYPAGVVRLAGTGYSTPIDAGGRFRMDSLPPGVYRIEVVKDVHIALGTSAVEEDVSVEPGGEATVELRETGLTGLLTRMCGGREVARDRTAMRVVLLDAQANRPFTGQPLRLWWTEYVRERGLQRVVQPRLDATTGSDGSVVFCGLPLNVSMELGVAIGPDRAHRLESISLTSRMPSVRTIRSP